MTESAAVPRITVRRGGQLVLTRAAAAMLGDEVTHVQVGYNPQTRAIGIRAAGEDARGRYRLREQDGGSARLVDGKRLFALHGLEVGKAETFAAEAFGDGIVGVTLPETEEPAEVPAAGPKRTKTRAAA